MIAIIDYGLGNVQAFANIYRRLNIPVSIARTDAELATATRIILPGVGAFDWAMSRLDASGMRARLDELVLERQCPVLGVCVGMQMMARRSEEGRLPGLGWVDAEVVRFKEAALNGRTHLPHMGWNDIRPVGPGGLLFGIDSPRYYFLHSYYLVPVDPTLTLATADYGITFTAAIRSGGIYGTQFHPEKSHQWGVDLLKNFAEA